MKKIKLLIAAFIIPFLSPAQGWQAMADLPLDFVFPVVVELQGNIHVMGGGSGGSATNLHVRYTPATDSWDTLAQVPYLAQQPAGAVVNGKIHYCGGGYPTSGQRLDYHYYYDPDSNAWYQAASLPVAVAIHKAVECDGKFYVLTGQPDKTLCEYYDPATNTWYQRNPLPDMNFWYGAIVAAAGTIFRFGGGGYAAPTAHSTMYDKVNDSWIGIPALPFPIHAIAGANVGDSLIWVGGGYANGTEVDSMWIYHIASQTYIATDVLPLARDYHSMVTVDGCVYSVGGYNNSLPQVAVSLLKNCSPLTTGIQSASMESSKPYAAFISGGKFDLTFSSKRASDAALKVIGMNGQTVLQQVIGKDTETFTMSGESVSAGRYVVVLSIDGSTYTENWMVTK